VFYAFDYEMSINGGGDAGAPGVEAGLRPGVEAGPANLACCTHLPADLHIVFESSDRSPGC
jgi:hypothetical protein